MRIALRPGHPGQATLGTLRSRRPQSRAPRLSNWLLRQRRRGGNTDRADSHCAYLASKRHYLRP